MAWLSDIQKHLGNPKHVTTSVVTANRLIVNHGWAGQIFSVAIEVVESPVGGRCLSLQTLSGSGTLLDSLLEAFDGLFV